MDAQTKEEEKKLILSKHTDILFILPLQVFCKGSILIAL